jgi:hypothetical protein
VSSSSAEGLPMNLLQASSTWTRQVAQVQDPPRANRRLKPGAVLVPEYQGERHTVTVLPGGFLWREGT